MSRALLAGSVILLLAAFAAGQDGDAIVYRSGVKLIEVYATVLDHNGRYIDGLDRGAFEIRDEGRAQPILTFEDTSRPVACAMVLDTTGSMEYFLPLLRNSALRFLDSLGAKDEIAVYTFSESLSLRQEFTTDRAAARRAILRTRASGRTALFDALAQAGREVAGHHGKKALVVFTDGDDNSSSLNADAAARQLRKLGVPVFAIGEGEALDSRPLLRTLRGVSAATGGGAFEVRRTSDVDKVFNAIAADLQHTYLLVYKAPSTADSHWRTISVSVRDGAEYRIRAREGYFPD